MEIFELRETDDGEPFYLNAAHVIAVIRIDETWVVFTSDGKTYSLNEKSGDRLRAYLRSKRVIDA